MSYITKEAVIAALKLTIRDLSCIDLDDAPSSSVECCDMETVAQTLTKYLIAEAQPMNWQIEHVVGLHTRNPAKLTTSLPEALEYMAEHGIREWAVDEPIVERMKLRSIGGRHRFDIINTGG